MDEALFVTTFQHIAPETFLNSGELVSSLLFNSNLCIPYMTEWTLQEGTCWLQLRPRKGFDKEVHVCV